jgi:precorrin-4 methylase
VARGRATFVSLNPELRTPLPGAVTEAVATADIVFWTAGPVRRDILARASAHADVIFDGEWNLHSLLPFYDLASREGFHVAHLRSDHPAGWDDVTEQVDRCGELGLHTETICHT